MASLTFGIELEFICVEQRDARCVADSHAADAGRIALGVIKHAGWIASCLVKDETSKDVCRLS